MNMPTPKWSEIYRSDCETPLGSVVTASYFEHDPVHEPHTHRFLGHYALTYILDGSGVYTPLDGPRRRLAAGDMVLSFPDVATSFGPPQGQSWREIYATFTGPIFDLLRSTAIVDAPNPIRRLEPIDVWHKAFLDALPPAGERRPAFLAAHTARFASFVAGVFAHGTSEWATEENLGWLEMAEQYLRHEPGYKLNLRAIALRLGSSYETFRKRFHALTGQTPVQYRFRARIDAAQSMLRTTNLTCKEIANILGFANEFAFSRRFKQATGQSPRAYRHDAAGKDYASGSPNSIRIPEAP